MGVMGWDLIAIYEEGSDPTYLGGDIEKWVCPNDGEPLTQGPNGIWRCKFDGYQPSAIDAPV